MNLAILFNRQYIVTQEDHTFIPDDVRARWAGDREFLNLLGDKQPYGWRGDDSSAHESASEHIAAGGGGPNYMRGGMPPAATLCV